jgi:hypothetical protein
MDEVMKLGDTSVNISLTVFTAIAMLLCALSLVASVNLNIMESAKV